MKTVYLALGSNIEPSIEYLQKAVQQISQIVQIMRVSALYQSTPYGGVTKSHFKNAALQIETNLPPIELLGTLKRIEKKIGRKKRERWGAREIDIDIIFFGNEIITHPTLIVPHKDYHNRHFVLQPLVDLAPTYIPPNSQQTLSELLTQCTDKTSLVCISKIWI